MYHTYKFTFFERGIAKGTCACGAIQYLASIISKEHIERAKELSEKEGIIVDHIEQEKNNNSIPPKPVYKKGGARILMNYYDSNRKAIEADIESMGDKATIEKWGISHSGWVGIKNRWNFNPMIRVVLGESSPLSSDIEKILADIQTKLGQLDQAAMELLNRGVGMDNEMEVEIIEAYLLAYPGANQKELAKIILKVIQTIENY
ncbi:MAG: hypothetical protein PHI12_08265 [Dehalococcoidales bacterium]|nr:hypothetical protein [Dehalococcoidales bacterium]